MVFHYFDGFGPKYIALVLAGGGTLASAATYLWRGGGKPMLDEMGLQDSESVLAPTTKSMKGKVNQVPQTQSNNNSNSSNSSSSSTAVATSGDTATTTGLTMPESSRNYSYKDVTHAAAEKAEEKFENLAQKFGTTVQQLVDWVSEKKITVISFVVLLYTLQHVIRRNKAHEHWEDELIRSGRVAIKPLESQSTTTVTSMSPNDSLNHHHNNHNNLNRADSSTVPSAESENSLENKNNTNDFPISTWTARQRPEHADPVYEKLIRSLSPEQLEEFSLSLLKGIDASLDADLVQRVRQEILSIAPTFGWKAVLIEPKSASKEKDDDQSSSSSSVVAVSSTGDAVSKILRFQDTRGNLKILHDDCAFALDLLEREAQRRRIERLRQNSTASGTSDTSES
jgi:hypothetical protein